MNPKLIDETLRTINQEQQREIAKLKNQIAKLEADNQYLRNRYIVEKSVDRASYPHAKKSS